MIEKNKSLFHERNPHRGRYDFTSLIESLGELEKFVIPNPKGDMTIDFHDAQAVLYLNKALLKKFYHVENWMIPPGYLCPPIPGRADYIHYAADLLASANGAVIPKGKNVHVMDIGTGANCIYPIIGSQAYGWRFSATEIDPLSLKTARLIVQSNRSLSKQVKIRQQKQKQFILRKIIEDKDRFDLIVCNPPFHSSKAEVLEANSRKFKNLGGGNSGKSSNSNFGGSENELWCPGGELSFIKKMIRESCDFSRQVCWFTSLVSKKENISALEKSAAQSGAVDIRIIPMSHGQKISRLIAWSFLSVEGQNNWFEKKN